MLGSVSSCLSIISISRLLKPHYILVPSVSGLTSNRVPPSPPSVTGIYRGQRHKMFWRESYSAYRTAPSVHFASISASSTRRSIKSITSKSQIRKSRSCKKAIFDKPVSRKLCSTSQDSLTLDYRWVLFSIVAVPSRRCRPQQACNWQWLTCRQTSLSQVVSPGASYILLVLKSLPILAPDIGSYLKWSILLISFSTYTPCSSWNSTCWSSNSS